MKVDFQLQAVVGKALVPVIKSSKLTFFNTIAILNGKLYTIATVKTNANGVLTIPAFSATKAGTYSLQLTSSKGVKYFIKLVVKNK